MDNTSAGRNRIYIITGPHKLILNVSRVRLFLCFGGFSFESKQKDCGFKQKDRNIARMRGNGGAFGRAELY